MSYKSIKINEVLTVITKPLPYTQSASFGLCANGGSSKENNDNNGIAHALEHMMFKGTTTKTNKEIGSQLEGFGAYMNAYTSEESVFYYGSVAPTNLTIKNKNNLQGAIELLFDMFLHSTFPEEELIKEKDVITQELRMYEDDLSSRCMAGLMKIAYEPDTYLHREIGGTEAIVRSFTSQQLKQFMRENYTNINFIIVGNFDEDQVIAYCQSMANEFLEVFGQVKNVQPISNYVPEFKEITSVKTWANQAQGFMAWQTVGYNHPQLHVSELISCILGQGISSLLFEKVREDMGLVYGIHASIVQFNDSGFLGVDFSTFNDKVQTVIDVVNEEMANFLNNLTDDRINTAKNYLVSTRIKKYETNQNMCCFLAESAIRPATIIDLDTYITICNSITREEIIKFYNQYLNKPADKISKILTE